MEGARSILLSITGGADLSLVEVSEAAKVVGEAAHPDANIIFGANVDEELSDQIWVTVVATRFDGRASRRAAPPSRRSAAPKTPTPVAPRPRRRARAGHRRPRVPPRLSSDPMRGVVAAGHPLTAEAGAAVLREGGNAVDAAVCAVLASFAVESPLTGFGAGGHMMVHEGGGDDLIDFFVAAPGLDGIERTTELVPVPVRFDAETTQTFYVGPASCGVPGTAAGLAHALERFGTMPLADAGRAGGPARPRGGAGQPRAGLHPRDPRPDPRADDRDAGALRAAGTAAGRGGRLPLPGTGGGAGTLRRRGRRALLQRRGGGGDQRLRRRPRRQRRPRRPRLLRGDRAQADRRPLPRHRSPHQPAALLRRDPDLLLPRPARAARPPQRPRAAGRGDGSGQLAPRPRLRRVPLRGGDGGGLPRPGRARPRRRRPARLDHPHLGPRRRRQLRQRHLLQRLRLRRAGRRAPG